MANAFGLPDDCAVLTTTYVMREQMPILYVTHEVDEPTSNESWQFHCGNGDYSRTVLVFVALSEVIALDATVLDLAEMPAGYAARRDALDAPWVIAPVA